MTTAEPQELRIALVMNGGVSLAVWMGGVTAELDRLRRAGFEPDAFAPAPAPDGGEPAGPDPVDDAWRCLLDALGMRVVIDVIAGASAGGLNGSLLAASIARRWVLPDLRQTWLSVASITRLASDRANPDRLSVLDGDFFAEEIGKVFERVLPETDHRVVAWPGELGAATELVGSYLAEQRRCPSAVTLSTAVTSVRGQAVTYRDSTGASFGQREYRVHCRFHHGIDRDDFARPQAAAQLTRSARASASFPGAFEAAFFNDDSGSDRRGALGAGPDMRDVAGIDGRRWVIDGGVLNNEPFDAVLDEIASRPIDRDIDRVVAYVVPSAGDGEVAPDSFGDRMGMVGTGIAAMNLPREMNLLNELDRMAKMASQADADRSAGARLLVRALTGELDGPADALLAEYRERRAAGSVWEARRLGLSNRAEIGLQPQADPDAEPLADRDPPLRGIPPAGASLAEATLGERWEWGLAAAERVIRTALRLNRAAARRQGSEATSTALLTLSTCLLQVDHLRAGFEQKLQRTMSAVTAEQDRPREILGHIDACYDDLPERLAPLVATALDTMVAGWPAMAAELRSQAPAAEGLEQALTAAADGHPAGESQPIEVVAASLHAMVDAWDGVITDLLAHDPVRALERLRTRAGGAVAAVAEAPPAVAGAAAADPRTRLLRAILRVEVVERATAPIARYQPVPRFRFQRFGVHTGTPLINAGTPITNKLFGTSAGHFGGFLRSSWRAHDWMWGRLDGATHLVSMLFVPSCLRRSLVDGVDPDTSSARSQALAACAGDPALAGHLDDFRAGCAGGATDERLREIVDPVRRAMIERLHQQILRDELPRMADDQALSSETRDTIAGLGGERPRYGDALDGVRHDLASPMGRLADSEQGHEVIGMMAASGLRALRHDPQLPGRRRLSRPLAIAASAVRLATASGPRGGLARGAIAALLLVLTLSPLWAGLLPESAASWFLRAALAAVATVFAFVALPVMPHWFRRGFGWLKRAPVGLLKR